MIQHYKDKDYVKLIHSYEWQQVRCRYLRQHPICERCATANRTSVATEVHHITPISRGANYELKRLLMIDANNMMALCHDCHLAIHSQIGGDFYNSEGKRTHFNGRASTHKRAQADAEEFAQRWLTQKET